MSPLCQPVRARDRHQTGAGCDDSLGLQPSSFRLSLRRVASAVSTVAIPELVRTRSSPEEWATHTDTAAVTLLYR
ncbi:MAG: hypothetical protein V2A73_23080 [Pseudomonadota bacterium]